MKGYSKLDYEEKIAKSINAHHEGYEIEAFTILFESIRVGIAEIIFFKGAPEDLEILEKKSYSVLTKSADGYCLHYRGVLELNLFRCYRNKVIHDIVYGEPIDSDLVNMWFNFGRKVYRQISHLIDYYYNRNARVDDEWDEEY